MSTINTVLSDEDIELICMNFNVEVHAYVKNGRFCVVNNTYARQKTVVYRGDGSSFPLEMEANEIKWYNI